MMVYLISCLLWSICRFVVLFIFHVVVKLLYIKRMCNEKRQPLDSGNSLSFSNFTIIPDEKGLSQFFLKKKKVLLHVVAKSG